MPSDHPSSDQFSRTPAWWVWFAVRLPLVLLIVVFNVNLWTLEPADYRADEVPEDVPLALDALVDDLRDGAGDEMQQLFPEGWVITHALVGFAWVDVALRAEPGSELHAHALEQARWLESRIDSEKGREIFSERLHLPYGAFYRGYLGWLRGGILLADPDPPDDEVAAFNADCEEIAEALDTSRTPFLESYLDQAWPADSVFLAATLSLHDELYEPRYTETLSRWVALSRELVDPATGIVPHAAETDTGEVYWTTRGTTAAVFSRMLWEVDPGFAADQYEKARELFVTSHLGLFGGFLEHREGVSGSGDVDSGPLVLGISGSASVVGIAAARFQGDRAYEEPTLIGAHAVGTPLFHRYGFGLLPVGEAFFAWTKISAPWVGPAPEPREWEPLMLPGWRFVWHVISLVVLLGMFPEEFVRRWRRRHAREKQTAEALRR